MRRRITTPFAAGLVAAALGLMSVAAAPPVRAEDEDVTEKSEPKVEKRVIRIVEDGDEERGGDAGYLGVQVQELTSALRRAKNIPGSVEGALVNRVEEDSPAEKAGIQKGDIILEVNGKATEDPSELIDRVRDLEPGSQAKIVAMRAGSRRTFTLTVGSRPEPRWEEMLDPKVMRIDPDRIHLRMEDMGRHRAEMERQLEEIRDELAALRRELRALRADLRDGRPGSRAPRARGDDDQD